MTYLRWALQWSGWLVALTLLVALVQEAKPVPVEASCSWMLAATDAYVDSGRTYRRNPAALRKCADLLWAEAEGAEWHG